MAVIYLCPADKRLSCPWEGSASEIKQHFENEHNQLLCQTNCVGINLEEVPENKLLFLEEEIYLMQSYIDGNKLAIKLRYLGSNEAAARIQYDITISINKISYKYDPSRYFSCIVPTTEGWEVNLECLEKFHGKVQTIQCTVLLNYTINIEREISDDSIQINNQFVEANLCDETELKILDDLKLVDDRLEELKQQQRESSDSKLLDDRSEEMNQQQRESGDFMDKISQLNFSILEEPFNKHEELKDFTETLPNIPEEVNLSCSSCHLDMLPPIYLCINGHNNCNWCKSKPCQICGSTITITRNTDLENISRTHLHQCRYSSEGCNERLFYNEVRAHEARCQYCKYKCMSACPYQGKFDQFHNHLKIVHSSVKLGFSTRNDFPKNSEMYIVNKSVGIFYCNSEFTSEDVIWKATFCGPSERQFFCELSFKGSKYKEPIFLKRKGNVYEVRKTVAELKKNKAKEKYAVLTITSYDS